MEKRFICTLLFCLTFSILLASPIKGVDVVPRPAIANFSDEVMDARHKKCIRFVRDRSLGEEAYEIKVRRRGIVIRSADEAGRFYALVTLGQLERSGELHIGIIKDSPRYHWRGFMLDEARHFHGKEKVKQIMDIMAEYKLNRFHWHLCDNQGWRIEIKAYPELTQIGGVGNYSDEKAPPRFYTQDDIREIVAYASDRHIEVVPEIDMPGHAGAAVRSLPVIRGSSITFNPASEETYKVLGTVIRELSALFPGRYFHIGGDEVDSKAWKNLPEVRDLMERERLHDVSDVQNWFGRRMADSVIYYGKTVAGWDDIATYGVDPGNALVYWWQYRRPQDLERDFSAGYQTIICPEKPFYLDYCQDKTHKRGFGEWSGRYRYNEMKDLYDYPLPLDRHVQGIQANLWSETVHSSDRVDFMAFPRLIALAEKAWTYEDNMDYEDFLGRLRGVYEYLDEKGVYYYDILNPKHHPEPAGPGDKTEITPYVAGCNYIPSTAINQLEMWQAESFDPVTIDRELGWAQELGFNCMRVFLHHLLWEEDRDGFVARIGTYLDIAFSHGIKTMFVFLDDCWDERATLGPQRAPRKGVHNSGWVKDPGILYFGPCGSGCQYASDTTAILDVLERYVKDILSTFKDDKRIYAWDLYNEPGGGQGADRYWERSFPLLKDIFSWAWEVAPTQPLTAGIWSPRLKEMNDWQARHSDIISYHTYEPIEKHQKLIDALRPYGKPMVCTEYMARTIGSTFQTILPALRKQGIGAINWGFVRGKTNTIFPWESAPVSEEPSIWFHDVLNPDGSPYCEEEINVIKAVCRSN